MLLIHLPVELIADILSELDLASLIAIAQSNKHLYRVVSDPYLNPWKGPIVRNLYSPNYEACLRTLSGRTLVPERNWLDILSLARPEYLLFEACLPNLGESDWEECFRRRFLPSWTKWHKEGKRRGAFLKMLARLQHRSVTSCTAEENWTKYIVLNRNGSANQLDGASRSFSPLAIFNNIKLQSNLSHLQTHVRLVLQLADVRILAFGVLGKSRTSFGVNYNARTFLHPPGVYKDNTDLLSIAPSSESSYVSQFPHETPTVEKVLDQDASSLYPSLAFPQPFPSYANYPLYTPGGGDKRWLGRDDMEEQGRPWIGGLMVVAQLTTSETLIPSEDNLPLQDMDLVIGPGRSQYASFTWADLDAIAPWMEEYITRKIDGPGLGH